MPYVQSQRAFYCLKSRNGATAYRNDRLKTWSSLSGGYANMRTQASLSPYAPRKLVKAIRTEAPDNSSGKRHQEIRISYDLVGFIPVEELLKQETA